jgi:hypothetical protein
MTLAEWVKCLRAQVVAHAAEHTLSVALDEAGDAREATTRRERALAALRAYLQRVEGHELAEEG